MECSVCKLPPDKEEKREIVQCDFCKQNKCTNCTGMSASEIRVMQLKSPRVLRYACGNCSNIPEQLRKIEMLVQSEIKNVLKMIVDQEKRISEQNTLIIDLLNEVKSGERNQTEKPTYANAVKNSSEVLVVMPKEKQESNKTKSDLKEKIDPKSLAIAVENIKEGKQGSVIINCSNPSTKEKIKEKVENELGTQYKVTDGTQKNPKIIICGVEDEVWTAADQCIIEMVCKQNGLEMEERNVQVISKYKQKNKLNKGNIIMTVSPECKNKICQEGKLNIGWRRCMVQEHFTVIRCFKCARYGHIAANCKNDLTCFKCSGPHKTSDCTSLTYKCINCTETNNKLKKSSSTNHTVYDSECTCYKRILELETKKTKKI